MHGHPKGHVLGKNGNKDGWGGGVSMFSEPKLGMHVINVCVLMKHGHITYCLTQDMFEDESKSKPELYQETVALTYGDTAIVYLKPKLSCKSTTSYYHMV